MQLIKPFHGSFVNYGIFNKSVTIFFFSYFTQNKIVPFIKEGCSLKCKLGVKISKKKLCYKNWVKYFFLSSYFQFRTNVLIFGVPQLLQRLPSFKLILFNKQISPETDAKDLGVQLDANLSYNKDITKSVSNCLFKLKQISRIKHLINRKMLLPWFLANYYLAQASGAIPAISALTNKKKFKTQPDKLFWGLEKMIVFLQD